ncbi:MAG TPA: hypothetical protein VKT53_04175 [Candidatus Acidoferrum sp.]|nr:hypothetical protein [Candidatus Acidoferrum sp.]
MRIARLVCFLLLAVGLLTIPAPSRAQVSVGIAVSFGPPALPVYEQPICPAEGYIWTPGYWAWDPDDDDYYWVPGTWVEAPEVGFLWTPGYWGWERGAFFFHEGYWGPHVGWYGGISYGFGYFGHGYEGGRWDNGRFYYNRSVTNVNITEVHNVYNTTIINRNETRVSYNGGNGGINERPSREEESFSRERHIAPVSAQHQQVQEARGNRELRASVNQGRPPIAATQRPGSFRGSAVVPAREAGGRYEPPPNRRGNNNVGGNNNSARPENNPNRPPNAGGNSGANSGNRSDRPPNAGGNSSRPPYAHAREIAPHDRPAPPNTGDPNRDRKYQQQQDKLYSKQEQEHQKLQQKQEQDHQRLAQQNANEARRQQVEQRHQQQTQQTEQRHAQQQQKMQERQQPPHQNQQKPPHEKP